MKTPIFAFVKSIWKQNIMERMNDNGKEKLSLWERAKRMGKVMELAPGFSFDSDSKVKTYV